MHLKIFRMNRLGIPQERIAKRLGVDQKTIHKHLGEMARLPFLLNSDLERGFTVAQVAEKHGWTAPMVWSSERFHAGVVSAMQKKRILGVTSRYVIVLKK